MKDPLINNLKLKQYGFKKNPPDSFENMNLPYWAKNGVLLFFNVGQEEYAWKIGYGEMRNGIYYVTTFRWIKKDKVLKNIYFSITGNKL